MPEDEKKEIDPVHPRLVKVCVGSLNKGVLKHFASSGIETL